jgi:hypothetical protein
MPSVVNAMASKPAIIAKAPMPLPPNAIAPRPAATAVIPAAALFLSNTIFCSIFLSMSLLEHSLLYFDIFEGKLFNQINKAITEEFFIVYFISFNWV